MPIFVIIAETRTRQPQDVAIFDNEGRSPVITTSLGNVGVASFGSLARIIHGDRVKEIAGSSPSR
jgi:hypothetical protein